MTDELEDAAYTLIDKIAEDPEAFRRSLKSSSKLREKYQEFSELADEALRAKDTPNDGWTEFARFSMSAIDIAVATHESHQSAMAYADKLRNQAEKLKHRWPDFVHQQVMKQIQAQAKTEPSDR